MNKAVRVRLTAQAQPQLFFIAETWAVFNCDRSLNFSSVIPAFLLTQNECRFNADSLAVSFLWHCGVPTELGPPFHLITNPREP
jgi:hypothetical protein